jgi:hypothetical protein
VLDVKVALQGGQAFVASVKPTTAAATSTSYDGDSEELADAYAEMQEKLTQDGQYFRTIRLRDRRQVHQMLWRSAEFEMHLTVAGNVGSPHGKALEVYAWVKDQELKFFIPVRIPLRTWQADGRREGRQKSASFFKRLAGILS